MAQYEKAAGRSVQDLARNSLSSTAKRLDALKAKFETVKKIKDRSARKVAKARLQAELAELRRNAAVIARLDERESRHG